MFEFPPPLRILIAKRSDKAEKFLRGDSVESDVTGSNFFGIGTGLFKYKKKKIQMFLHDPIIIIWPLFSRYDLRLEKSSFWMVRCTYSGTLLYWNYISSRRSISFKCEIQKYSMVGEFRRRYRLAPSSLSHIIKDMKILYCNRRLMFGIALS